MTEVVNWSKAAINELMGMPFCQSDGLVDKSGLIVYLALLLSSEEHRSNAMLLVESMSIELDTEKTTPENLLPVLPLSAPLPAMEIKPRVVKSIRSTDPFLVRLANAKNKPLCLSDTEKLASSNITQEVYLSSIRNLVVQVEEKEETDETVGIYANRSIFRELGTVSGETTSFDCSTHLLGTAGFVPLCDALATLPNLTYLSLSRNYIKDRSIPPLVALVETSLQLTDINLSHNGYLSATAGRLLLSMVKKCSQITELNLEGCNVPPYYLKSISEILHDRNNPKPITAISDDEEP